MLPEARIGNFNTAKADIYILGINSFLLHSGGAFPKMLPVLEENPDIFWAINNAFRFSEDFKILFRQMVASDPESRITLQGIELSNWLIYNQVDDEEGEDPEDF